MNLISPPLTSRQHTPHEQYAETYLSAELFRDYSQTVQADVYPSPLWRCCRISLLFFSAKALILSLLIHSNSLCAVGRLWLRPDALHAWVEPLPQLRESVLTPLIMASRSPPSIRSASSIRMTASMLRKIISFTSSHQTVSSEPIYYSIVSLLRNIFGHNFAIA